MNKENISSIGPSWDEVRKELFIPEENAASDVRVAIIGELIRERKKRGVSQKKLEQLSGVKQPIIARMERGSTNPQLETIIKVLAPLGKTLYVGVIKPSGHEATAKAKVVIDK